MTDDIQHSSVKHSLFPCAAPPLFSLNADNRTRACLKIHFCHLYAPFCGSLAPNPLNVAHYAAHLRNQAPAKCDAHLTESNFQTRPEEILPISS
ncbi:MULTISPECIES: DUF6783 domain-containing protein [Hungatella]|uniref:DUF6783 domain-containing protein n=1 Tax=Hungatella TaxID=1649459 RepID=UPI0009C090BD